MRVEDRAFPLALGASGRALQCSCGEERDQHSCCSKVSASNPGSLMELKSHKSVMGLGAGGSGGRHRAGMEEEASK